MQQRDAMSGRTSSTEPLIEREGELDSSDAGADHHHARGIALSTGAGALSYSWDVNGDGTFGDATGATPTLSYAQLVALGLGDGPTSKTVSLRVTDAASATSTKTTTLTINNVAPAVSAGPDRTYLLGEVVELIGDASDPAPNSLKSFPAATTGTTPAAAAASSARATTSCCGAISGSPMERLMTSIPSWTAASIAATSSGAFPSSPTFASVGIVSAL